MNTLHLRGIRKSLCSHLVATELNVTFEASRIHGVTGPNGAGKTSFLNLLSGFFAPDSGTISFRGSDITRLGVSSRAKLGFRRSFQNSRAYRTLTVADNILLDIHCPGDGSPFGCLAPLGASALERARLKKAEVLWNSWMTGAEQSWAKTHRKLASELSLGEAKAFELIRLFLADPAVLLLDEPTAGLAAGLHARLAAAIATAAQEGATVIVVSHESTFLASLTTATYRLADGALSLVN